MYPCLDNAFLIHNLSGFLIDGIYSCHSSQSSICASLSPDCAIASITFADSGCSAFSFSSHSLVCSTEITSVIRRDYTPNSQCRQYLALFAFYLRYTNLLPLIVSA